MHALRTSARLKLLFALLLALSVGGKVGVGSQSLRSEEQATQDKEKRQIINFLDHRGFQVDQPERQLEAALVPAAAGNCRLLVVLAAPQGWHRDVIRRFASPQDQVFFVFDAAVSQDQPMWFPWLHYYWRMLNSDFGRRLPVRPVLGIVASSTCDLRNMPWQELAELS